MIHIAKPQIGAEEKEAVLAVLDSGILAQNKTVAAFEEAFATYCGTTYAVATSGGTTALQVMLEAHNIGVGDEVITTPFTFIASGNAIIHAGATPVFVDIDPVTFCLDTSLVAAKITSKTKAILPVHFVGMEFSGLLSVPGGSLSYFDRHTAWYRNVGEAKCRQHNFKKHRRQNSLAGNSYRGSQY